MSSPANSCRRARRPGAVSWVCWWTAARRPVPSWWQAPCRDRGARPVLGEASGGRSSVQTLIPLDRFAPGLGELSITVSQLYRIDGSSFEGRGLAPDIAIPGAAEAGAGEVRTHPFPGTPLQVPAAPKEGAAAAMLPSVSAQHRARMAADGRYQKLVDGQARALALRSGGEVSLDEAERRRKATFCQPMRHVRCSSRKPCGSWPTRPRPPPALRAMRARPTIGQVRKLRDPSSG
ncbi:S41 family peptidase [Massilia sp. Dwa41.01b]|uniref:S41 family peptidase n=1 Tax=Massilia sp. Dwa41.01b TaxID=2709302 RepID=UPI0035A6B842